MFRHAIVKPVLFLLAATTAMACDSSQPITWSKATPKQTQAALSNTLSLGLNPAFELGQLVVEDHARDPLCPKMTLSGQTEVYEASGCTSSAGHTFKGRLERTVIGTTATGKTIDLVFGEFSATTERGTFVLDGDVHEADTAARTSEVTSNLRFEHDDVVLHIDAAASCSARRMCKTSEGASGSIEGLGEFSIDLQIFPDSSQNILKLKGTDELQLSPSSDNDGCFPYTIDGKSAPGQHLCNN